MVSVTLLTRPRVLSRGGGCSVVCEATVTLDEKGDALPAATFSSPRWVNGGKLTN